MDQPSLYTRISEGRKVRNREKSRGESEEEEEKEKKLEWKERENNGEMGERNRESTYKQMVVK